MSPIRKELGFTQPVFSKELTRLAHHSCEVSKGSDARVRTRDCSYSPQGGAHEPPHTLACLSGQHSSAAPRGSLPTSNPNSHHGERQAITELQHNVTRTVLQGWIRHACGQSGVDTKGRVLLKDLQSKASA